MSRHLSTTLTIISLAVLSLSAPGPAGAADPKCIPNTSFFPSTQSQDALSRLMCGPNGGTYPSAIPSSNGTLSTSSLFNFSPSAPAPSPATNSLLGATFGSGLNSDLSSGSLTGTKPNENCNRFITPEPEDALSQFMCGPGGGKYLVPGLLNGLPNLPVTASPTTVLPTVPTVLPSVSPTPAPASNQPAKLPAPPAVSVTPAKTETSETAPPAAAIAPSPAPSPVAQAPLPVAVDPSLASRPTSAPTAKQTSIFDNPVFYLVAGILVLVVLSGGLILLTGSGAAETEGSDQEDSD